jgi:signal peptidase II
MDPETQPKDATPTETPTETATPPQEVAPTEATTTEAIAPLQPAEPERLAADVERLAPCEGAARTIPDPDSAGRPSPLFLAIVSVVSLASDIGTKLWAEKRLDAYPGIVTVWENHLSFVLAKNRGGAWGLLQGTNENVRRPFFLLVSAAAIAFIVALYRRLQARQRALKWGLPLVLGGALGNVFDRIRYGHVIDFIDFRADWLKSANEFVAKYVKDHVVTDHWPTFNVADIAICVGVGLMAVDMFSAKRRTPHAAPTAAVLEPAKAEAPAEGNEAAHVAAEAAAHAVEGGGEGEAAKPEPAADAAPEAAAPAEPPPAAAETKPAD